MPRGSKDGSVFARGDRLVVRKRYRDLKGRLREKSRYATTQKDAVRVRREIDNEIADELAGAPPPTPQNLTFNDLIAHYRKTELKPAEYHAETKISGLRSWRKIESQLKPLQRFFGPMRLRSIVYEDVAEFKRKRLSRPTIHGRRRSLAAVNRELSLVRHLLFLAQREGWIAEHPFHRGRPLIQIADENSRMRILSWEEEERLLSVCVGPRAHLRLALLAALETGLRHGEQFTLEYRDVNMDDRIITVRAFNSKTARSRMVPVFDRLHRELAPALAKVKRQRPFNVRVFPVQDHKRSFRTACRLANIEGLRWHDLRHTAATRMLHFYELSEAETMKILGHTSYKTFLRYVNLDGEIARRLRLQVDSKRAELALPMDRLHGVSEAVN
jgi:integrase